MIELRGTLLAALALTLLTLGCGGYSQRLEEARVDVRAGALAEALASVDALVERGRADRSPENRDLPLLLLERATILQAMGDHRAATADLAEADAMLEVLDLTPDRAGQAAEYLFADNKGLYRPPVYEKLMVNVLALASYLGDGHIRDAMVEARRIRVLVEYFGDTGLADHPMLASAAYLAGIAMERGGDDGAALRFYLDAWRIIDAPGLPEAVVRLGHASPVAPDAEVARAREARGMDADAIPTAPEQEVVTIAFSGLAPYRVAERVPIGIAFAWMRQNIAYSLGEDRQSVYNRIVAEGLLTWVNFPSLVVQENRRSLQVTVDGVSGRPSLVADVEAFALAQWEEDRPGIAFAAITRAITRVLAREAIQLATGQSDNQAVEVVGFLASLAAQGAMQAADQPDTRTWSLMPAYVWVARTPVEPGTHEVTVRSAPVAASTAVEVGAGRSGFAVLRLY